MDDSKLEACHEILKRIHSHTDRVKWFLAPVDTTGLDKYNELIEKPIDLQTLKANLDDGKYTGAQEFLEDFRLIFQNAIKYNRTRYEEVYNAARYLLQRLKEAAAAAAE
eukprot:CAMPEP_0206411932 /NCGR_PEP_ID=MMETSP0294-20121207/33640_1 /ASSEMBLY_ACC=CAM_ASM_000327 /TAXON_ID=39354 /ORGANISM="Heterosigma akashiwo, Strain CCMP2393" /LENGTH=108 /DNA_ID=CAMNT_0053872879 /DNA_START=121 /DNA_END=444 /DNA_ORIENTATION=-